MLFAISLAKKLGKRGLVACSVHPGTIISTGLTAHLDLATDVPLIGMYCRLPRAINLLITLETRDRALGNPEGWNRVVDLISPDEGAATYIFASFEPSIQGI